MKRKIFIGISVIIGMLVTVNIYGYVNNVRVSNYIEESNTSRKKLTILDEFRGDVVEISQLQKLYMLTQKQTYKESFDTKVKDIYQKINDLYDKGYINKSEKEKLYYTIKEYEQVSAQSLNYNYDYKIDSNLENQLLKFNNHQLKTLHEITLDIDSKNESLESKNEKVTISSKTQAKLIQGVSSIITVLVSGFAYYFKSKFKVDDKEIEKIIDYLTNLDDDKVPIPKLNDSQTNNSNDLQTIDSLKSKICENEILLSNANLLYKQSVKFQDQCDKSELILNEIDVYVSKLKLNLELIDDYPTSAQKIILDDIEKQLIEFKILFKSLPNYNDFIIDISKNMTENNN